MTRVEKNQDDFVVDATLLAEAFNLQPEDVQTLMRSGQITSLCETGTDEDAGRTRLTFHYQDRAARFVVDQSGTILNQASFPARSRKSIADEMFPAPTEGPKSP
tara:strand:- start:159 stop:470 length:312 start_codon:yes stop_codon:yes gene_type:complete